MVILSPEQTEALERMSESAHLEWRLLSRAPEAEANFLLAVGFAEREPRGDLPRYRRTSVGTTALIARREERKRKVHTDPLLLLRTVSAFLDESPSDARWRTRRDALRQEIRRFLDDQA